MFMKSFHNSIVSKYLMVTFGILLVSAVGGGIVIALFEREMLRQSLLDKGSSLASYMSTLGRDPLIMKESLQLDNIVKEVNRDQEVVYAVIKDEQGTILTSRFASMNLQVPGLKVITSALPKDSELPEMIAAVKKAEFAREVVVPISEDNEVLGMVVIGMSGHKIRGQVIKTMAVAFAVNLLAAGVLGIALFSLSRRILVRPIAKLTEISDQNELRFRSFVENANDVLFALTPAGVFNYVSPQWKEATGYELSETIGQPFMPFIHPDDVPVCTEFLQQVIGKGEKQSGVEYRVLCKDGTYLWYTANASRVIDPVNDSPMLVGIGRNMTERKKAEKALSESEKKYRTLFENSMDMISLTTPDGKIIDINPAGVNLSGYPSKEALLSASIQDMYADPKARARFLELMNKNGFVTDYETMLLRHDGQKRQVSINASAVRDELGNVTAIQGIIRDVTERRTLEDQLRQSQKMEAIGLLAGGIAHDFNNILTVFISYGSMLRDKLKNDAVLKSYAEQIIESTDRAVDLTQGLLAFSRKQTLRLKPIDLNDAVRNTMKFLKRIIGEDVEVKTRLADGKVMVTADSGQIGQVLMNIATNARDAMPHGGLLSIQTETLLLGDDDVKACEVEKAGMYACISVADTGQGMDKTTMDKIFEPFFTTKAVGKGTGLGLAIVYGIIKQHCGTIRVYSEPGTGTVFKIYLPLTSSATAQSENDALPVIRGRDETILLVEDNAAVRATIKIVLEDGGYNVIEAVDGDDAMTEFNKHRDEIALLLTDVIMPKKNGKELYDMIRGIRPEIKALFISGYTADIITSKGLLDEGLHLMNKPLAPDPLKRRIREILDSGQDYHE